MEQVETSEPVVITKNRRVRLVLLGLIQVGFGMVGMVMTALIFLGLTIMLQSKGMKVDYDAVSPFYSFAWNLCFAGCLLTLGIGSVDARRWARSLSIVLGWLMFTWSLISVVVLFRLRPVIEALLQAEQDMPPGASDFVFEVFIPVTAVLMLGFPLLFVLAYSGKHVRATCERMHPEPCWTDRLPISILVTAGLLFMVGTMILVWLGPIRLDFLGAPVSMPVKNLVVLSVALLYVLCAWGLLRLKPWAWWGSIVAIAFNFLTVTFPEPTDILDLMGLPDLLYPHASVIVSALELGGLVQLTVIFVMLVATRRHFRQTKGEVPIKEALSTTGEGEN